MPQAQTEKYVQESDQRSGKGRLTGSPIDGITTNRKIEQFVPETKFHTHIGQTGPDYERPGWKHRLVIGSEKRGQQNRHDARYAQQNAIKQMAITAFLFKRAHLPQPTIADRCPPIVQQQRSRLHPAQGSGEKYLFCRRPRVRG